MLVVKGGNGKSKWLNENFIDGKTLIIEQEYIKFPKSMLKSNSMYVSETKENINNYLDCFAKEYFADEIIPNMFEKVVLWGHLNYNRAFEFESKIREVHPEFTVAFAMHCNGESVEIYEFNNFENGGFEND